MENLFSKKSNGLGVAAVVGISTVASLLVVFAISKSRKACIRWIEGRFDEIKKSLAPYKPVSNSAGNVGFEGKWMHDLKKAEKLKGTLSKRKDPSLIKVDAITSNSWKKDTAQKEPFAKDLSGLKTKE